MTDETKLVYREVLRQEYAGNNCIFSAGFADGYPVDTMYIKMAKDGVDPTILFLRPDEMACIAWLVSGVLWSNEMDLLDKKAKEAAEK
jgi:hypothetical protein